MDLLTLLQAATEGSRELDDAVLRVARYVRDPVSVKAVRDEHDQTLIHYTITEVEPPTPTRSLDAITALIEARGWFYSSGMNGDGDGFWALVASDIPPPYSSHEQIIRAKTEPLARCIAFVRAEASHGE